MMTNLVKYEDQERGKSTFSIASIIDPHVKLDPIAFGGCDIVLKNIQQMKDNV